LAVAANQATVQAMAVNNLMLFILIYLSYQVEIST
jgi:hypothetical protein